MKSICITHVTLKVRVAEHTLTYSHIIVFPAFTLQYSRKTNYVGRQLTPRSAPDENSSDIIYDVGNGTVRSRRGVYLDVIISYSSLFSAVFQNAFRSDSAYRILGPLRAAMWSSQVAALRSPLRGWLERFHIRDPAQLASLFTDEEVDGGQALSIVAEGLGKLDVDAKIILDKELKVTIAAARKATARDNQVYARRPSWELSAERDLKRLRKEAEDLEMGWCRAAREGQRSRHPSNPLRPRFGTSRARQISREGDEKGRANAETAERERWVAEVVKIADQLKDLGDNAAAGSSDPKRAVRLLVGGRRAATLRARVREWRRMSGWLRARHRVEFPESAAQVSDYLCDRLDGAGTKSALAAAYAALRFVEDLVGISAERRVSNLPLVVNSLKELKAAAAARRDGNPPRQAPCPPAMLLVLMEGLVADATGYTYDRLLAWWCLVSAWSSLRFDDHRGLAPDGIGETEDHYTLIFERTKTTGADKGVSLRPGVVSKGAWLKEQGWFRAGWLLWSSAAPFNRDYMLCPPAPGGGCLHRELGYAEYAGYMRSMLSSLHDQDDGDLGNDYAMYFTPHSFRTFLPTALEALGASSSWMGWLLSWRAKGGQLYARAGKVKTILMQKTISEIIREYMGGRDPLGERDNLVQLGAYLRGRGVDEEESDRVQAALTAFPREAVGEILWPADGRRTSSASQEQESARAPSPSGDAPPPLRALTDEAPSSGYTISIGKRGIRRLHLIGACYRVPGVDYVDYIAMGDVCPPASDYHAYCRSCWSGGRMPATEVADTADSQGSVRSESESSSSASSGS